MLASTSHTCERLTISASDLVEAMEMDVPETEYYIDATFTDTHAENKQKRLEYEAAQGINKARTK